MAVTRVALFRMLRKLSAELADVQDSVEAVVDILQEVDVSTDDPEEVDFRLVPSAKKKAGKIEPSAVAKELAAYLLEEKRERYPKLPLPSARSHQANEVEIDRLIRIDMIAPADVRTLIHWIFRSPDDQAEWWRSRILSAKQLRKHFEKVAAAANDAAKRAARLEHQRRSATDGPRPYERTTLLAQARERLTGRLGRGAQGDTIDAEYDAAEEDSP